MLKLNPGIHKNWKIRIRQRIKVIVSSYQPRLPQLSLTRHSILHSHNSNLRNAKTRKLLGTVYANSAVSD